MKRGIFICLLLVIVYNPVAFSEMKGVESESQLESSAHADFLCADCHFSISAAGDQPEVIGIPDIPQYICKRCHSDKYSSFTEKLHFQIKSRSGASIPTCIDCHGYHAADFTEEERSKLVTNCGVCHEDIFIKYKESVHGAALISEDNRDVPACLDCHSVHVVGNKSSSGERYNTENICKNCHADKKLMEKYALSTAVVNTYLEEFHLDIGLGKEITYTNPNIANCTNCHGTHDISTKTETESVKNRLKEVCIDCHEAESLVISNSWLSHYIPSIAGTPLIFGVSLATEGLLVLLVIGFFLQIFIHAWRYLVGR